MRCFPSPTPASGIPPEVLRKVFEPFFTTKEVGKGTGLGLSMVYGFIKQSSGHVSIYSELGHGTTVKLFLPRSDGMVEEPSSTTAAAVPGGTERILVVEDEPQVRANVVRQLAVSAILSSRRPTARPPSRRSKRRRRPTICC